MFIFRKLICTDKNDDSYDDDGDDDDDDNGGNRKMKQYSMVNRYFKIVIKRIQKKMLKVGGYLELMFHP